MENLFTVGKIFSDDNSILGTKPFPAKKGQPGQEGCYAGSKLFVEQQLARHTDWTPAAIEMRRGEISDWAMTRWHVDAVEEAFDGQAETAVDTIQRVVTRMFIPRGQMLLYKALYEAGQGGVPYDELHKIVADWSVEEIDRQYRTIWNKNWRSQRADLDLPSST